jgi:NAD(P)-dependent dehydrogenase (short-subunit alcohol dehydrogenase family)
MGRLGGKRALVTGASGGIGRAIAERFAAEGADIAVGGYRNVAGAEETASRVRAGGQTATVALGDLACEADVERLVEETATALGGLDIVVNNAATYIEDAQMPAAAYDLDVWDRTMAVNLRGPLLVLRTAMPYLLEHGNGVHLAIGSVSGIAPWKGDAAYSVAKAGLHMLTQAVALDYAELGIRSNCICPGVIETDAMRQYFAEQPEQRPVFARLHPVNRLGTAGEVAALAVALCSDEASFITGALVPIDGGYLIP